MGLCRHRTEARTLQNGLQLLTLVVAFSIERTISVSHRTKYLLAAENRESYERFAQVDEPERLEADLALGAEPL